MIADQGELVETIVDEMDLDDEEYKTFVEVEMVVYLKMKIPSLKIGATLAWMSLPLMTVMTITGCTIKWRSQVVNYFMIRSTCSMLLRSGLS